MNLHIGEASRPRRGFCKRLQSPRSWNFDHTGSLRTPPYIITKCIIHFWHWLRCYVAKSQLRNLCSNFVPMTRRLFT